MSGFVPESLIFGIERARVVVLGRKKMEICYQQWNQFNVFETSVMVDLNHLEDVHVAAKD